MHYTGTKKQCEDYNLKVSKGENYKGSTQQWDIVQECKGAFYIFKHDKYVSKMELVDSIPYEDERI